MINPTIRRCAAAIAVAVFLYAAQGAGPVSAQDRFLPTQIPGWTQDQVRDAEDYAPATPAPAKSAPATTNQINKNNRPTKDNASARQDNPGPSVLKPLMPQDYELLLSQMQPSIATPAAAAPLEDLYSKRIIDDVRQFGYDLFASPTSTAFSNPNDRASSNAQTLPAGAVQDHFVLNIGDKLNILFRGQRNTQGVYSIGSDGLLIIDDLAPIPASGRTIAQLREALSATAADLYNTNVFVSLDSVQQVGILIVGHVQKPGRQNLTVFHTVLDALMQAGGVQKTGSLRQIKLIRDGRTQIIDLYGLLVHGTARMDLSLRDGDRIIVPTIGPTLAIAGGVKRPGIYEILPSLKDMRHSPAQASEELSLQEALDLGGGLLSPGNNRFMKLAMSPDGREIVEDLSAPLTPTLGDGSILMVSRANEKRSETVELAGHTRQPGIHALSRAGTLSALISDAKIYGPDIYPLIGVIERTDTATMSKQMIDFPPQLVVAGQYDRKLQDGDKVLLFSRAQILDLQKSGKPAKPTQGSTEDDNTLTPDLEAFLKERSVYVRGAVRDGGLWPVSEGATLNSVIAAAGGFSLEANTANIEITTDAQGEGYQTDGRSGTHRLTVNYQDSDPDSIAIAAGDAVRVNQKFRKTSGQSVMIVGEINHPGKYDLLPGDTLGKLIERSGGITAQAYPDGTIFSREADRKAEEARFRAAAQELERAVAAATEKAKNPPDATQIAMAHDLANELRNVEAVGRITVQADPSVLKTQPEQDILLEPSDRIYIPRRPMTVRVHGEVLSPANLQFRSNKTARNYIDEAGGMTYYADDDRAFVLFPDGSAQPLLVSAWNHKATMIPPGATIVIPRDPKPFSFMETAKDFSQILSNLAITGIFLRDLQDDE